MSIVLQVNLYQAIMVWEHGALWCMCTEYIAVLRPLFEHMAQTRGMTNAYLNGKSAFKPRLK